MQDYERAGGQEKLISVKYFFGKFGPDRLGQKIIYRIIDPNGPDHLGQKT